MAKLINELNKGLRGRLGNLVYYELNGSTCVRSLPKKYKDRKSDKQIVHRERNYVSEVKRKELSATVNLPFGGGEIITYTIAHRRAP